MEKPLFLIKNALSLAILLTLISHPATVTLLLAFAQSTGTISGRVTSLKTGMGIFEAAVSAVGPSQQVTTTDSQGYYIVSGLAPGPYAIGVSASGYVGKSISPFFIYPTDNTLPDFTLNMLSIRGWVYNASMPDIGIAEANITIGDHFIPANLTGHYEWLDLSNGTYTLTASAPGYSSQSAVVSVSAGATAVADFGLDSVPPGRISGNVKDASTRQGVSQATVQVSRGSFEQLTYTDQSGQYTLGSVPAWPSWTVIAYKVGYEAQSTITGVQSGATTTWSPELVPFGVISGTVKNQATNQPIAEAVVQEINTQFINTTNSNGYYTVFALEGTYSVKASAPGFAPSTQPNVKVSLGKTTTVNFLLQTVPPGRIFGTVTDVKTGYGIPGAVVVADSYHNVTDASGSYVLSNVAAWTYDIIVTATGFVSAGTQRGVPAGGSARADFQLSPYTRVYLEPYLDFGNPGQSFNVRVDISDSRFVYRWDVYLWWNPTLLDVISVAEGSFLKGPFGNRTTQFSFEVYANEGVVHIKGWSTLTVPDNGVSGSGTLATMTFQVKAAGACGINLTSAMLYNPQGRAIFPNAILDALFRTIKGDVNNDGVVDALDLSDNKEAYGSEPYEANWNPSADVNQDQAIDAFDLHSIGRDYGKST
jgi:hypothetical protein